MWNVSFSNLVFPSLPVPWISLDNSCYPHRGHFTSLSICFGPEDAGNVSRAQEVPGGLPRPALHPSTHLALSISRELSRYKHFFNMHWNELAFTYGNLFLFFLNGVLLKLTCVVEAHLCSESLSIHSLLAMQSCALADLTVMTVIPPLYVWLKSMRAQSGGWTVGFRLTLL